MTADQLGLEPPRVRPLRAFIGLFEYTRLRRLGHFFFMQIFIDFPLRISQELSMLFSLDRNNKFLYQQIGHFLPLLGCAQNKQHHLCLS
ncbi:MAG: hypothetical protein UT16_C0031G0003 [Candidatus Azambacteria bacterium GW2011_GWA2_39_10]|uniref:Uncharacterized protein n=1 Tax=Candidatus Azambacteria bacterium GW2011_GWA2_39_10 TaxID=1618611 RepID=A0A0G0LI56_9BACT|nr:MAG: hypothetical protein UT16_C0031G0003 [Candidatus Azambacteria bacterium GW2011_GWA2_39_10]